MNIVLGVSASTGIGIGKAFVLPEAQERVIPRRSIDEMEIDNGWTRFTDACTQVQVQIDAQLSVLAKDSLQHVLFETYQLMLADPVFTQELRELFVAERINIEYALEKKIIEYADRLRNSGNDYLSERAQDIEDVFGKVQDCLLNYHPFNIEEVPDNVVLVSSAIRPSDTFILNKRKILGLALTEGGTSSHVAILARSFGIPAVVGLEKISEQVKAGDEVIVDGVLGEVILSPDGATVSDYGKRIEKEKAYLSMLAEYRDKEARTKDGTLFKLMANIGTPEEADTALEEGADGIGLFRTEFLFMNALSMIGGAGGVPTSNSVTEDAQFEAYKYVLQKMGDRPVTIRTLDAGGDKLIDMKNMPDIHEHNPLMGLRAIRLSLYYPQVFRTQLRALYRASVYGNLRIMLPLITDVAQVDTIKGIARGVQLSLKEEGIPYREDVPIGIMVETAAAAITSDCLAKNSAFFSIGTNDLIQYTLGIDRENPTVAPLYNEYNLAVIRLLHLIIHNAWKYDVPLSVCGEMAGRKESAIILAGMGIRTLSMAPRQIPIIKSTLASFSIKELENISSRAII
ncbi:MAG: phosphoenolpyruvate--protein phosphotransferase [Treponema sp.]|nr:phosphoenolpyruvate--protein phosphotransferase [Treponema sp.]